MVLFALIVAFIGPWAFDRVNVPAEYPCEKPFIRLQGDFCGLPIPGYSIVSIVVASLLSMMGETASGTPTLLDYTRGLFSILVVTIFFLPIGSTLLTFQVENTQKRQIIQIAVWGLAAVTGIWFTGLSVFTIGGLAWGIWLYNGIAVSEMVIEGMRMRRM